MPSPHAERNTALLAVRTSMHLSQDELAQQLQRAALKHGDRIAVSKRTVQRWESGTSTRLRPAHARALQDVTGLPIESLGFPAGADAVVVEDGSGGHDLEVRTPPLSAAGVAERAGIRPESTDAALWSASLSHAAYTRRVVEPPPPWPRRPATVRMSVPAAMSSVAE